MESEITYKSRAWDEDKMLHCESRTGNRNVIDINHKLTSRLIFAHRMRPSFRNVDGLSIAPRI